MERDLAKHLVSVGFKTTGELTDLLELLKDHCDEAEYAIYLREIANKCGAILVQLSHNVFSELPDLEVEVETKIKKYGKFI